MSYEHAHSGEEQSDGCVIIYGESNTEWMMASESDAVNVEECL